MIDAIGYIAALVTFAGFLTNNLTKIRVYSLTACLIWVWYALLINSGSILLCNSIIGALQIFKISQAVRLKRSILIEEIIIYKLSIEKEMMENSDASLCWELDRINNKLKKLTKKFLY